MSPEDFFTKAPSRRTGEGTIKLVEREWNVLCVRTANGFRSWEDLECDSQSFLVRRSRTKHLGERTTSGSNVKEWSQDGRRSSHAALAGDGKLWSHRNRRSDVSSSLQEDGGDWLDQCVKRDLEARLAAVEQQVPGTRGGDTLQVFGHARRLLGP